MTLLRQTAQLVEDLRTLNVIREKDDVRFSLGKDGIVYLEIKFNDLYQGFNCSDTVQNAIKNEFEPSRMYNLDFSFRKVSCCIKPDC